MSHFVKLPDAGGTLIDPTIVTCVRIQSGEDGASVVIAHTSEGYAVPLLPGPKQSGKELLKAVARILVDHEPES